MSPQVEAGSRVIVEAIQLVRVNLEHHDNRTSTIVAAYRYVDWIILLELPHSWYTHISTIAIFAKEVVATTYLHAYTCRTWGLYVRYAAEIRCLVTNSSVKDDDRIVKDFEESEVLSDIRLERLRKSTKTSIRIPCLPTKIRTKDIPNKSQDTVSHLENWCHCFQQYHTSKSI